LFRLFEGICIMEKTIYDTGNGVDAVGTIQRRVDSAGAALHSGIDKVADPARSAVDRLTTSAHETVDKLASTANHTADRVVSKTRHYTDGFRLCIWPPDRPLTRQPDCFFKAAHEAAF
jgi:cell division septum initiation protein DivIVA